MSLWRFAFELLTNCCKELMLSFVLCVNEASCIISELEVVMYPDAWSVSLRFLDLTYAFTFKAVNTLSHILL